MLDAKRVKDAAFATPPTQLTSGEKCLALSNSLWAKAMADARTNVEAMIEEYLTMRTR